MPLEKLERQQIIPITLTEAWSFFGRPENLADITPPSLGFRVTSSPQGAMYSGMILTYSVRPLLGLTRPWVTEITHCREPYFFVDEQRLGPYRFWHHQHHFREVAGGVEVRDLVHYILPFGFLGRVASGTVRRRLAAIFDFRRETVQQRFNKLRG
ncbi:MAG: SRPBCC family protein [Steroidobacteraceae bacterium]|nr:SRPBCC family protein [Deltaproteobacteria bacterium]